MQAVTHLKGRWSASQPCLDNSVVFAAIDTVALTVQGTMHARTFAACNNTVTLEAALLIVNAGLAANQLSGFAKCQ